MKIFSKQKPRELITSRPAHQEMLKKVLQAEKCMRTDRNLDQHKYKSPEAIKIKET